MYFSDRLLCLSNSVANDKGKNTASKDTRFLGQSKEFLAIKQYQISVIHEWCAGLSVFRNKQSRDKGKRLKSYLQLYLFRDVTVIAEVNIMQAMHSTVFPLASSTTSLRG